MSTSKTKSVPYCAPNKKIKNSKCNACMRYKLRIQGVYQGVYISSVAKKYWCYQAGSITKCHCIIRLGQKIDYCSACGKHYLKSTHSKQYFSKQAQQYPIS